MIDKRVNAPGSRALLLEASQARGRSVPPVHARQASHEPAFIQALINALESVGSFGAYVALLDVIGSKIRFDRAQVMAYPRRGAPSYLHVRDTPEHEQQLYLKSYELDPLWRHMFDADLQLVHLQSVITQSDRGGPYLAAFFGETGMCDELAFLLPSLGGRVGLFIQSSRPYLPEDVALAHVIHPLLGAMHSVQDRMSIMLAQDHGLRGRHDGLMVILDGDGREVFRGNELKRMQLTFPGLADAIACIVRERAGIQRRIPGGVLYLDDLGDAYLAAPGARVCSFLPDDPRQPSPKLQDAIDSFAGFYCMSRRQAEVLDLMLRGSPSSQIAAKLNLTEGTVRNHRKRIHDRMDVTSEREIFTAFLAFLGHGLSG